VVNGLGFDRSGSYGSVLVGFFLATLLAVVLMTRLGPYRFRLELQRDDSWMVGDSEVGSTRRYCSESHGIAVHNSLAA